MRLARRSGPPPTPRDLVGVVDVTDYGLGPLLTAALTAAGHRVEAGDARLVGAVPGLVVLAPVRLEEVLVGPRELWLRLERLAAAARVGEAGPAAPWIVVLWAVTWAERAEVATAHDGSADLVGERRRAGRNGALLLSGGHWDYELRRHRGDGEAATRCRSAQLLSLLTAESHRRVSGVDAPHLCADLATLDPGVLHGTLIQVGDASWTGWEAAVAAVGKRRDPVASPAP